MSRRPFLNTRVRRTGIEGLSDSRLTRRTPFQAAGARQMADQTCPPSLEGSNPEPVRRGDPDHALVRSRRRDPVATLPLREIGARLARLRKGGRVG